MGAHVHGDAVNGDGKVGTVVEIIAAQEILVGFALAGMLRHDETRHGFERFARPRERTCIDLLARDGDLAGHAKLPLCTRGDAAHIRRLRRCRIHGDAVIRRGRLAGPARCDRLLAPRRLAAADLDWRQLA
ncbi:hypothetical protein ABH972_006433 [Bradyrhizobium ottawaense]